jgi:hypothetical protein
MNTSWTLLTSAFALAAWAGVAQAQSLQWSPLLGMSQAEMGAQVKQHYDVALRLSLDPQVIRAPDGRYFWSLETKAECGIAIGFLKARHVDDDSVRKCDNYSKFLTPPAPQTRGGG